MTLRESLYAQLTEPQKREYDVFEATVLAEHVKPRAAGDGQPFIVDKRNRLLGGSGRETLRDPQAPGWPSNGPTTTDPDEARAWAAAAYVPRLWVTKHAASVHPAASSTTVQDAVDRWETRRTKRTRNGHGEIVATLPGKHHSRRSVLRKHVTSAFGNVLLASLTRTMVREEAENLTVRVSAGNGRTVVRDASHGTKLNFLRALTAIWRDAFPDVPAPFAGVKIRPEESDDQDSGTVYDLDKLQEQLRAEDGTGGMDPNEVRRAVIGAWHRDRALMARANVRAGEMIPNTAHLIAFLVATGVRISEARRVMWGDIDFERGFIIVRQSKLHTNKRGRKKPSKRLVPLQDALRPWLEALRIAAGIVETRGNSTLVFRTARTARATQMAAQTTLIARITKALLHAEVKPAGKATHWARSTHATLGKHAPGVKGEELQHFLGHRAFQGSTEDYIALLISVLRDEHRRYIPLPTPEEVADALAAFEPAAYSWRASRRWQSRSREAKAART